MKISLKFLYVVLEKRIFENFRGPFDDEIIFMIERRKKKIKAEDLRVTSLNFESFWLSYIHKITQTK